MHSGEPGRRRRTSRRWGASSSASLQQTIYNMRLIQEGDKILRSAMQQRQHGRAISLTRQEALVLQRALDSVLEPRMDDVKHRVHAFPADVKEYLLDEFAESPLRRLGSARSMRSLDSFHAESDVNNNTEIGLPTISRKASFTASMTESPMLASRVHKLRHERVRAFSSNDVDFVDAGVAEKVVLTDEDGASGSEEGSEGEARASAVSSPFQSLCKPHQENANGFVATPSLDCINSQECMSEQNQGRFTSTTDSEFGEISEEFELVKMRALLVEECGREKKKADDVLLLLGKLDEWSSINVFQVAQLAHCGSLVAIGFALFERHGFFEKFDLPVSKVTNYLHSLQSKYVDVPYHNSLHGADVAQALNHLFVRCGLARYSSEEMRFAALFAALAHDVAHPGVNNSFLVRTSHPLAIRFNDVSVLEMMHASVTFEVLQSPSCNMFVNNDAEFKQNFRSSVIKLILATDNAEHQSCLSRLSKVTNALRQNRDDLLLSCFERLHIMEAALHAADLSASGRPWNVYRQWTDRIRIEFHQQGDLERKHGLVPLPFMDRTVDVPLSRFQSGFIEAIALPIYEALDEVPGLSMNHILQQIRLNLQQWSSKEEEPKQKSVSSRREEFVQRAAESFLQKRRSRSVSSGHESELKASSENEGPISSRRKSVVESNAATLLEEEDEVDELREALAQIPRPYHRFREIDAKPG